MKLRYITRNLTAGILTAGGVAAAIVAAPTALAADTTAPSCTTTNAGSICQSPGNTQINDSAPVQFAPQYPYWEGDYFGGYGGYGGYGHGSHHR
jgi:hypothetical protein